MPTDMENMENRLKSHAETQDRALEAHLKVWILSALVAHLVPLISIAFFLGGIYNDMNDTKSLIAEQRVAAAEQRVWMEERRRWELSIELWAAQQKPPFKPPTNPTK